MCNYDVIKDYVILNIDGWNISFSEPDECPMCKHVLKPEKLFHRIKKFEDKTKKDLEDEFNKKFDDLDNEIEPSFIISIVFFCNKCKNIFICEYFYNNFLNNKYEKIPIVETYPQYFIKKHFDKPIINISPMFVKIYNQALQAEYLKLNEICGIGYRKALEFLIKDYLIHLEPNHKTEIIKSSLSSCIKKIDDEDIRTFSEKSAWLGNDEAHYIRKHIEYDFKTLKRLIDALSLHIQKKLLLEEAKTIKKK